MKAFLLSSNLNNDQANEFKKFIGKDKVKKALLITTAAVPYGLNPKPDWLQRFVDEMSQFAEIIDETTLEDGDYIPEDLSQYDFIFVSGGNTFYLAYRLAETGLGEKIKDYIKQGGMFSGSSAGAIILMGDIENIGPADDPSKAPALYPGLGLIDFAVIPHAKSEKYGEVMEEVANKYRDEGVETVLIEDNQVLVIDGEEKEIV